MGLIIGRHRLRAVCRCGLCVSQALSKAAEPIELPFGRQTAVVVTRNCVLDGPPDLSREGKLLRGTRGGPL